MLLIFQLPVLLVKLQQPQKVEVVVILVSREVMQGVVDLAEVKAAEALEAAELAVLDSLLVMQAQNWEEDRLRTPALLVHGVRTVEIGLEISLLLAMLMLQPLELMGQLAQWVAVLAGTLVTMAEVVAEAVLTEAQVPDIMGGMVVEQVLVVAVVGMEATLLMFAATEATVVLVIFVFFPLSLFMQECLVVKEVEELEVLAAEEVVQLLATEVLVDPGDLVFLH